MESRLKSKFGLGRTLTTPGALEAIPQEEVFRALQRHADGDWGEVCPEDAEENTFAVENGLRILSAYTSSSGVKFWIITEADRSATTVLLPNEY